MKGDFKELKAKAEQLYMEAQQAALQLLRGVQETPLSDLADIGYLLRGTSEICDDLRKECNAKLELVGETISKTQITALLEGDLTEDTVNVRGELCTACPDTKMMISPPSPNSPEFSVLCEFLGIPPEARGTISFSYKRLSEAISQAIEEGRPYPSVLKQYPKFFCVFRKVKKG